MSQPFVQPTAGRLLDGRELRVAADGVRVGERSHPLARIQEARLLFLRPETIMLRLADVGQVEYSFARQGDGIAALEALYQLRPELRRSDAPAPALEAPAAYLAPVAAPQPLAPPATPAATTTPATPQWQRPSGPMPFPPQIIAAYGADPHHAHAGLTPIPRTAGQLISSAFRLFGKHIGALLALALLVATAPAMAIALLNATVSALTGVNPLAPALNPLGMLQQAANGQTPSALTTPPTTTSSTLDIVISLLSLLALLLSLLVAGWSHATLTIGAREATLGRPISLRACAREGFSRLWPTLWALVVLYTSLAIIAIPGFAIALSFALAPSAPGGLGVKLTTEDIVTLAIIAGLIAVATLAALAYLWTRLALYPTAAALGLPNPLRTSLSLTAFGWWRVFRSLIVVTLVASLLTGPAAAAQWISVAVAAVALSPVAQLIAGPLSALILVSILYDQRLRREGYALFLAENVGTPPATPVASTPEHPSEVNG